MHDLATQLAARTPLLWVQSHEPRRVIHTTIENCGSRRVFRIDPETSNLYESVERNGLRVWVLVLDPEYFPQDEDGNAIPLPINDPALAFRYIHKAGGIQFIENAHIRAKDMLGFVGQKEYTWMDAFFEDDAESLGSTIVFISINDDIPLEIARSVVLVNFDLPTAEELSNIISYISKGTGMPALTTPAHEGIVRAGLGLTEAEFINALTSSLVTRNSFDPELIMSAKLSQMKKDGLLEIKVPSISMTDIGGLDGAKTLIEQITWVWRNPAEAKRFGVKAVNKVVLVGVPGCGKSRLCEAAATEMGLELVKFGVSKLMSKFIGESETNARRAFKQIHAMAPLCLWTDEVGRDFSGGASSNSVDGGTTDRVQGEFLTGLQELPDDVFWFAAANKIDHLPPEMLRSGRIDTILFVGLPTQQERRSILSIHLGEHRAGHDLDMLAKHTSRFTGAELAQLVKSSRFDVVGREHRMPTDADIIDYIPRLRNRLWITRRQEIVAMYKRALTEWEWASSEQYDEADRIVSNGTSTTAPAKASQNVFERAAKK